MCDLTSPFCTDFASNETDIFISVESDSNLESSPNSFRQQSEKMAGQSSPTSGYQLIPTLNDSDINPQLKNFLMVILLENRAAYAKILANQSNTTERLTALEACVKKSNEDHSAAIQGVKLRVESVETDLAQTKINLGNQLLQLANTTFSCSRQHPDNKEAVQKISDRLEIQDRANRRSNLIFSGLAVPESEVKKCVTKILADKFGYFGPVMNMRTLRKAANKNASMVGVLGGENECSP